MYFRDVLHQERALSLIQRAVASGRVHHAWLFDGPEGVGKERAAMALAARLLCTNPPPDSAEPCGGCASCALFAAGNHPDFQLVHRGLRKFHPDRSVRASKGLFLVVDLVRHFLIEPAAKMAQVSGRRVFIVREAERLNEEAQNALLKTLEEPPAGAVLILVTSSSERLLPTIRSRCARVPFALLPRPFVESELQRQGRLDATTAGELAALAEGQLGLALRWKRAGLLDRRAGLVAALEQADHPEPFAKAVLEIATELAGGLDDEAEEAEESDAEEGDEPAEETPKAKARSSKAPPTDRMRDAVKLLLRVMANEERAKMLAYLGVPELAGGVPRTGRPRPERIRAIAAAEQMLDRNVSPQLALEALATA
jgi:DNA polymerase-3 subunit delta'